MFLNNKISTHKILKSLILNGNAGLIHEIKQRLLSDNLFYINRRDLTLPFTQYHNKLPLALREVQRDDIPKLLNLDTPGLASEEIIERIRLLRMLQTGIRTCYVVVTDDNKPCHMAWLIESTENKKIQIRFHGRILPLAPDEVLFEDAYTLEEYRGLGIHEWRISKFYEKALKLDARWAINYIPHSNIPSLNAARKVGFIPFMLREDNWRFFRVHFKFKF
jgi:GNAT superfamily N-acetyltransferase